MSKQNHGEMPKAVLGILGIVLVGLAFAILLLPGLEKDSFTKALVAVVFAMGIGALFLAMFPKSNPESEINTKGFKFTVVGGGAVVAGVLAFIYASTSEAPTQTTNTNTNTTQNTPAVVRNDPTPQPVQYRYETFCLQCTQYDAVGNIVYQPQGVGVGGTPDVARANAAQNCYDNGGNYQNCLANAVQVSP